MRKTWEYSVKILSTHVPSQWSVITVSKYHRKISKKTIKELLDYKFWPVGCPTILTGIIKHNQNTIFLFFFYLTGLSLFKENLKIKENGSMNLHRKVAGVVEQQYHIFCLQRLQYIVYISIKTTLLSLILDWFNNFRGISLNNDFILFFFLLWSNSQQTTILWKTHFQT